MNWLSYLLLFWLLWRVGKAWRERKKPELYVLDAWRNGALALAHPMAVARIENGFADAPLPRLSDELALSLRPLLLHYFGLRNEMSDAQIRSTLRREIGARWFRFDLEALSADDAPRDALAFACARLAFSVRLAALLGWLDEETQWSILGQNAQRARMCFDSWFDYGTAWARGRRQWLARSRADGLGVPFGEPQVRAWLADVRHPWNTLPWAQPLSPASAGG